MKKEEIRPFIWGAVVGAIGLPIVMFSAGWVVTSGSARDSASQMTARAVVDSLAPICVAQFPQDANRERWLKELKTIDSWKRGDFVKDKGWATMPGSTSANGDIADECARRISLIEK
ncbi:MAG: hypothetical protein HY521_00720 [Proteobacteria bacterium]|nr:hypothetical protein [Pseudomonadota bacterium]